MLRINIFLYINDFFLLNKYIIIIIIIIISIISFSISRYDINEPTPITENISLCITTIRLKCLGNIGELTFGRLKYHTSWNKTIATQPAVVDDNISLFDDFSTTMIHVKYLIIIFP